MTKRLPWWLLALAGTAILAGCNANGPAVDEPVVQPVRPLGPVEEVSLADLLAKSRPELAAMCEEWTTRVKAQEKARRDGTLPFTLLSKARLPLVIPVFQEVVFSQKAGFSLPPYVAEDTHDNELALHLARFGDTEAARRLADPANADTLQRIEASKCDRNYPVEWTRLVALMLHGAEFRLASGDPEGRSELASLHGQLRKLLDAKAARGPLGAVLLARGQSLLGQAAGAWREAGKDDFAQQADADLAAWGDVPAPPLAVPVGATRAEVERLLRSRGQGRVVPALCTLRALDVLALPVPADGAQAVIATFDKSEGLAEVLVTYRPRIAEDLPAPADLAHSLEDFRLKTTNPVSHAGLHLREYVLGDLVCESGVASRSSVLGGFFRCASRKAVAEPVALPRDFGAVHLDRSFEQNRLWLVPEQAGESIRTTKPAALAQLHNPLAPVRPTEAILLKQHGHDLLACLTLRYPVQDPPPPVYAVALPLWAAFGTARVVGVADAADGESGGGHLALVWAGPKTFFILRLPHVAGEQFELQVQDRHTPAEVAARGEAVAAFDRAERQARRESGKALKRIARHLDLGLSAGVGRVELGMSHKQAREALPRGQSVLKLSLPDGLNVLFTGEPPRSATHVVRQAFLRFDGSDRLMEVRVRYGDGPAAKSVGKWTGNLLAGLKKQSGAAPELPAPWATVWAGLPAQKPQPLFVRWQDDLTEMTFQRDAGGAEVTLRDRSDDRPTLAAALEYLPRGPEGCTLGEERDALLRKWGIAQPTTLADGAIVLPPRKGSPHEVLLVWFERGRASRIVARHVRLDEVPSKPTLMGKALLESWGRNLRALGWPRRQVAEDDVLKELGWHDDRTRIRLFWQESDNGPPHVFTEWKGL